METVRVSKAQVRASTYLLAYNNPSHQQINPCAAVKRRPHSALLAPSRQKQPAPACVCWRGTLLPQLPDQNRKEKKERNPTELKIRLNSDDPLHSSKSELNSAPHACSCEVTAFVYYLEANRSFSRGSNQPGHLNTQKAPRTHGGVCPRHKHRAGGGKFIMGQTECFQTGMARNKN